MNKNNAMAYVPFIVALADGHDIQVNIGRDPVVEWANIGAEVKFDKPPEKYRIKVLPLELHAVYNARGDRLYVGEKKGFDAWMLRNDPRRECKYTFKKFVEAL